MYYKAYKFKKICLAQKVESFTDHENKYIFNNQKIYNSFHVSKPKPKNSNRQTNNLYLFTHPHSNTAHRQTIFSK